MSEKSKLEDIIAGTRMGTVGSVFRLVEVAEEEIAAAALKYPEKAAELRASFNPLLFPGQFTNFSKDVYRAHARELLERVAKGENTKPGTDAECLVALSLASLKAPLTSGHLAAMERVFATVYPDKVDQNIGRAAWPTETDEILSEIKAKIARRR